MVETKTLYLPNEISNIICSYIESPTHKLISNLYFDPIICLKLNRKYKFKHIDISRLLKAIDTRCPHCLNRLNSEEYIHRGIYEKCSGKKLCIQCLEKEKFRLWFELFELIFILLICMIVWSSMLHIVWALENSH